MKREAWIEIRGISRLGDQKDVTQLSTKGSYCLKNNSAYISYEESEATGFAGVHTVLKVEGDRKVTLTRRGTVGAQLMMEQGVRHLCHYGTEYGDLQLGVFTNRIASRLDENGGSVEFAYSLDVNSALASENEVSIQVKCRDEDRPVAEKG